MQNSLSDLTADLPAMDWLSLGKFALLIFGGVLLLGLLFRMIKGRRSDLNHALSSAMGILFVYAVTVVIYTFAPAELFHSLSPLPYIRFEGETLHLFTFTGTDTASISSQVLSMLILAFLVNLLDTLIPKGEKVIRWYLLRFLTVLLSIVLHAVVTWALDTFLPVSLALYAPPILLCILTFLLLLGLLKLLLGIVLTVVSPVIGAIYAFFFSNKIGKQISKAVLTTLILTALALIAEYFGFTVIMIGESALAAYIPIIAALLVVWYLIGHIL